MLSTTSSERRRVPVGQNINLGSLHKDEDSDEADLVDLNKLLGPIVPRNLNPNSLWETLNIIEPSSTDIEQVVGICGVSKERARELLLAFDNDVAKTVQSHLDSIDDVADSELEQAVAPSPEHPDSGSLGLNDVTNDILGNKSRENSGLNLNQNP